MKKIWDWLGEEKNHNAITAILAFIAVIVALPFFSKQINDIQIKVDSVQSAIQELYNRNVVEKFTFADVEAGFTKGSTENQVKLTLANAPIENSVMLWFTSQLSDPTNYTVSGTVVDIDLDPTFTLDQIKALSERDPNVVVVSYTKAL